MKIAALTALALVFTSSAFAAETVAKKCVFDGFELYQLTNAGQGPFKKIESSEKSMGIPRIFNSYKKQLGEWDRAECQSAVRKVQIVSFADHGVYTLFFTNEDRCDGGNSYGLILGAKNQSPNKDGVVATINDSFIQCL